MGARPRSLPQREVGSHGQRQTLDHLHTPLPAPRGAGRGRLPRGRRSPDRAGWSARAGPRRRLHPAHLPPGERGPGPRLRRHHRRPGLLLGLEPVGPARHRHHREPGRVQHPPLQRPAGGCGARPPLPRRERGVAVRLRPHDRRPPLLLGTGRGRPARRRRAERQQHSARRGGRRAPLAAGGRGRRDRVRDHPLARRILLGCQRPGPVRQRHDRAEHGADGGGAGARVGPAHRRLRAQLRHHDRAAGVVLGPERQQGGSATAPRRSDSSPLG